MMQGEPATWQELAALEGVARTIRDGLVKLDDILQPTTIGATDPGESTELRSASGYRLARIRWHRLIPPQLHVCGDRISLADARALRDFLDDTLRRAAQESSQQSDQHEPAGE